jgi:hypothetical protein
MPFKIDGSEPSPDTAKPTYYNNSGVIQFPRSGDRFRGDGYSVTVGKPWVEIVWPNMPSAGAAFWFGKFSADTDRSVAATNIDAYNSRTAAYTTYSTGILHFPRWDSVEFKSTTPIYKGFKVLITELS